MVESKGKKTTEESDEGVEPGVTIFFQIVTSHHEAGWRRPRDEVKVIRIHTNVKRFIGYFYEII